MSDARVIAVGAVSSLGVGEAAYDVAAPGQPARTCLSEDAMLLDAGLSRPRMARAPADLGVDSGDRATDLLVVALERVCARLDACLPDWREQRIGVCVGTSSGGMIGAERFFAARQRAEAVDAEMAQHASYFAPYVDALTRTGFALAGHPGGGVPVALHRQIVAACASSTIAIGLATRWLDRGACDLVLAGGYDGVSLFVAAGFEAIRATSAGLPQPFRSARDGMLLGEGAGMVALMRDGAAGPEPLFFVSGFGASADAVHITAPDRSGGGLVRAGRAALGEAKLAPERVALVSAHGTATPYNDAAEARAIHALCAPGDPVVHPFKAQIGHTLGAAGVLESLAAAHAMTRGVLPAAYGRGEIDPDASVRLLERAESHSYDAVLKLSAAFGGVTAALVLGRERSGRSPRPARRVSLVGWAAATEVDREALAEATGIARDRLARIDDLGQLAIAGVAALAAEVGASSFEGAGVVAGYALATLDTNARFYRRLLDKGPRWVDPRLFPATSPNSGAGHCAIAYGLTGPNFAVGGGLGGGLEALVTAADLIAAGDAERIIVVSADDDGDAARHWMSLAAPGRPHARGVVAALLTADGAGRTVDPTMPMAHDQGPIGHLALLEWLKNANGSAKSASLDARSGRE